MTRYEKMFSDLDEVAELLYETDYYDGVACPNSPLRVKGECPVPETERTKTNCVECFKAWLKEEVKDEKEI